MIKKLVAISFLLGSLSACSHKKCCDDANPHQAEFNEKAGDRVHFGFNKHTLTHEAHQTLSKQAHWLNESKHTSINAYVEGHCDIRGTEEYNMALGEKRATAAKHDLVKHGVHSDRLEVVSYGKTRPVAVGTTDQDHAQNRRAVTVLK